MSEQELQRMLEGDCSLCCKAAKELSTLTAELAKVEGERDGLLCIIHRDGGHYITEHGLSKAIEDGTMSVLKAYHGVEAAKSARDTLLAEVIARRSPHGTTADGHQERWCRIEKASRATDALGLVEMRTNE